MTSSWSSVVAMGPSCLAQRFSHLKDNFAPCPADGRGRGRSLNLLSLVEVLRENLKYALTGEDSVRDFP